MAHCNKFGTLPLDELRRKVLDEVLCLQSLITIINEMLDLLWNVPSISHDAPFASYGDSTVQNVIKGEPGIDKICVFAGRDVPDTLAVTCAE